MTTAEGPSEDLWPNVPAQWRERLGGLTALLQDAGLPCALVGGCVRDLILHRQPKDWDIVVEGDAGATVKSFAKSHSAQVKEHPDFLTYAILFGDGTILDVATARRETYKEPGALPTVQAADLAADAKRRDFSVNAMYLRLLPDKRDFWDPMKGYWDLTQSTVRALHEGSFSDDPTRIYRAARYAGRFGWQVETNTAAWIKAAAAQKRPLTLSAVRRRNELFHILEEDNPGDALALLWNWDMWRYWSTDWIWTPRLASRLQAAPKGGGLVSRLAPFLGPDPLQAEAWLKAVAAPTELRRRVVEEIATQFAQFKDRPKGDLGSAFS